MNSNEEKEKNAELGKLFSEERKKRNLSLGKAVAKLQGITITREYLWMIENGKRTASSKICDAICDAYGLPSQTQQQKHVPDSFMSLMHELRKLPYPKQMWIKQIIMEAIKLARTSP